MYPRPFEYRAPSTVAEACRILADTPGAKVLAGGQSLIPLMKMRLFSPPMVVDIGRIGGLGTIEEDGDHVAIGALVRHAQTASSRLVATHATALGQAAALTGDVQVRNLGTTCGSLAHVDIAADQPAAAIAVGATLVVQSPSGTREIPAADFCVDTLTSALQPDEILVKVRIAKAEPGERSAYDKLGRRGGRSDYAVAGAAAWVRKDNGTVTGARVAVTGVGTKPTLVTAIADGLVGTDGSPDAVSAAAERATDGVVVLEDLYGSTEYKEHLARVYVRRALSSALGLS